MVVLQTDPLGKEAPYLERGLVDPNTYTGQFNQPITKVMSKVDQSRVICQIEQFHDPNPRTPTAFRAFRNRFDTLYEEIAAGQWATVAIDGVTFLELISRKMYQYDEIKGKEPRRWYASSTEDLEELLMQRAGAMRCNVIVCAHLDKAYDEAAGGNVHHPAAPGRMSSRFGAGFPEMYVCHGVRQADGQVKYWLQTRTDAKCAASSVFLQADDPCYPDYRALWTNYDAKHGIVNDGGPTADNGGETATKEEN
jgi:hypothetical protein